MIGADPAGHEMYIFNWLDDVGGNTYTDGISMAHVYSADCTGGGGIFDSTASYSCYSPCYSVGLQSGVYDSTIHSYPNSYCYSYSIYSLNNATIQQELTTLYRSVSQAEAASIMMSGKFSTIPGGLEAKQFGFSLEEVQHFGTWANQATVVAVDIPTNALSLFDLTQVDKMIFKCGTLTVIGSQLDLFNSMIVGAIRIIG